MNPAANIFSGHLFRPYVFLRGCGLIAVYFILTTGLPAQNPDNREIHFGSYYDYSIILNDINPAIDLEFGTLISGEGYRSIGIADSKRMSIEGVKYLDVLLEVKADQYLLLDGNINNESNPARRIPFTLGVSYANRGTDNPGQATPVQVSSHIANARFRILDRGNAPPGPPPTPVHGGYNPELYHETAYFYLYGSVNVGNIEAGNYSADIIITINYD